MRMTRICANTANDDANKNHNPNYTNENKIHPALLLMITLKSKLNF